LTAVRRAATMRPVLHAIIDKLWLVGAGFSTAFLLYGGYLYVVYQCRASVRDLRAIARLAMHETARGVTLLAQQVDRGDEEGILRPALDDRAARSVALQPA
jgi:hypothetical protein